MSANTWSTKDPTGPSAWNQLAMANKMATVTSAMAERSMPLVPVDGGGEVRSAVERGAFGARLAGCFLAAVRGAGFFLPCAARDADDRPELVATVPQWYPSPSAVRGHLP